MFGFRRRGSILGGAVVFLALAAAGGEGHATTTATAPWQGTWVLKLIAQDGPNANQVALVVRKLDRGTFMGANVAGSAQPLWVTGTTPKGSLTFAGRTCDLPQAAAENRLCATKSSNKFVGVFRLDGFGPNVGYSGRGVIVAHVKAVAAPLPGQSEPAVLNGTLYTSKPDKKKLPVLERRIATIVATRQSTDWRLACTENWWSGTWLRIEHEGEATFKQTGTKIGGSFTWFGGGSFGNLKLSDDCRTMTGTTPTTAQLKAAVFTINLIDKDHFTGHWRWTSTPSKNANGIRRWDGTFTGARTSP